MMLPDLWRFEIDLIVRMQQLPGWFEPIMQFLSLFGREEFFLILLPVVYWCISPRAGVRLGVALLVTAGLNAIAKLATHAPRPYWLDSRVQVLSTEPSFGMPSGHAQTAVVVWGTLAAPLRRRAVWWAAGILAVLISFSRIYLGVHFVSDVVAGLLLGLVLLLLLLRLEDPVVRWWQRLSLTAQLGMSALVPGVMLGSAILVSLAYSGWTAPAGWSHVVAADAESLATLVALSGSLLGLLAGASIMSRLGWFSAAGPFWQRVLRWLIGSVGVAVIWFGLREALPDGESLLDNTLRFLRYALLSLWIQLGAPLLFLRLRLVTHSPR